MAETSDEGARAQTAHSLGTFAAFDEFDEGIASGGALGIDSGASLLKICHQGAKGRRHFATWTAPSTERVLALVRDLAPERLGVTGCGAARICSALGRGASLRVEFDAWARGAREMLESTGLASEAPYLLVSVGTGTTMLRVEGDRVERVGGTALGGGTVVGLGFALTGAGDLRELIGLAEAGARGGVDLLVGDLFDEGEAPLMAQATASSFGKLGRDYVSTRADTPDSPDSPNTREVLAPSRQDLAAATLGLVAENIGLMANARASAAGVSRIVYGGSTLNDNPRIADLLRGIGLVMGFETLILPHGGHAGALGALLLAS